MKEVQSNEFIARLKDQYQFWFGLYVDLGEQVTIDDSTREPFQTSGSKECLFNMRAIVNMLKHECPDEWEPILSSWKRELFAKYGGETPQAERWNRRIKDMEESAVMLNKEADKRFKQANENMSKAKKYIRRAIIVTAVNIAILLGHIGLATILG